jgi:hypothetical protein
MAAPDVDTSKIETLAEPIRRDFPLFNAVVTDQDGHYEVAAPPGKEIGIVYVIAENCVPAGRPVYSTNPSVNNQVDLDSFPLYPAGEARINVGADATAERYRMVWQADEAATANWAAPLKGSQFSTLLGLEDFVGHLDAAKHEATFLLPARVLLHVTILPQNGGMLSVPVADTVRVEPGQVTELGGVPFRRAYTIPAVFHVIDAQGKPVEGVPVRTCVSGHWSSPTRTLSNGSVQISVVPGIVEKVGIRYADGDLSFTVSPDLEASATIDHTFKITPEQLKGALAH